LRTQLESKGPAGALTVVDNEKTREELLSEVVFLRKTLLGKDASFRKLVRYQEKEHFLRERESSVQHASTLLALINNTSSPKSPHSLEISPGDLGNMKSKKILDRNSLVSEVVDAAMAQARASEIQVGFLQSLLLKLPARTIAAIAPEIVDFQMLVSAADKYRAHLEENEDSQAFFAWLSQVEEQIGGEIVLRHRAAFGMKRERAKDEDARVLMLQKQVEELSAAQMRYVILISLHMILSSFPLLCCIMSSLTYSCSLSTLTELIKNCKMPSPQPSPRL